MGGDDRSTSSGHNRSQMPSLPSGSFVTQPVSYNGVSTTTESSVDETANNSNNNTLKQTTGGVITSAITNLPTKLGLKGKKDTEKDMLLTNDDS
ncbi:unnamed protein product [Didymodactylos carnosus]|uniref:Uncharacterized protein n=1 Tax=Didymodactylos carnosus TaxID=1234261 RepID=A0A8S2QNT6_9BILA|nr:unnamed protein product [Didymodactylos carnosus]CAF4117534.1 unnamed protein product [Didymodactylos carnosus]